MAEVVSVGNDALKGSWHRWFRRTNVYIAEYILMLVFVGALIGVLGSLWYSFFGLLANEGYTGKTLAIEAAVQLGALLVVGVAAFWLYSRVTGQEMVQPERTKSRARTVFLTIWMIGAVVGLVAVIGSTISALVTTIFGLNELSGVQLWVGMFLPSLFAVATIGFGIAMVVKNVSRSFVMRSAIVVASTALVLVIANTIMILVRKDAEQPVVSDCTYSQYRDEKCSYSDYQKYIERNTNYNSRSNDTDPESDFSEFFN